MIRTRRPRIILEQRGYTLTWYDPNDLKIGKLKEGILSLAKVIYQLEIDIQDYEKYNKIQKGFSNYLYKTEVPIEFWIKVESLRSEEENQCRIKSG